MGITKGAMAILPTATSTIIHHPSIMDITTSTSSTTSRGKTTQ